MKKVITLILAIALIAILCNNLAVAVSYAEETAEVVKQESPAYTIDLTGLFEGLIVAILAVIARYLIPLIKTDLGKKLASIAVNAAEQLFITGVISDRLTYAEEFLHKLGIKANTRALVEAAVSELNKYKRELDYQLEQTAPSDPDADVEESVDAEAGDIEDLPECSDSCNSCNIVSEE